MLSGETQRQALSASHSDVMKINNSLVLVSNPLPPFTDNESSNHIYRKPIIMSHCCGTLKLIYRYVQGTSKTASFPVFIITGRKFIQFRNLSLFFIF